jgi:hypothetical protein
METAKYKELAECFVAKYYPQFISRVDRIWDMLYELDLGENTSEPAESKYQIGNGLAFGGEANPELSVVASGIDIIVKAHKGAGDNTTIEDSIFKIRINTICDNREINPDLKHKLESTISEFLQSAITQDINKENTLKEPLEYYVWTPNGKSEATQQQIDNWKNNKTLLVDDDKCVVYIKGVKNIEIMKNEALYVFLKYLLKNKGSARPIDIYEYSLKERALSEKGSKEVEDIKNIISSQKQRLVKLFKNRANIKWRFGKYHLENYYLDERKYLEEPLDFILAKEKLDF